MASGPALSPPIPVLLNRYQSIDRYVRIMDSSSLSSLISADRRIESAGLVHAG